MRLGPSKCIIRCCSQLETNLAFSAEKAVNDRLAQTPELYLLALAQFAASADTEVVRTIGIMKQMKLANNLSDAILLAGVTSTSALSLPCQPKPPPL
jgi:hypothetical protein